MALPSRLLGGRGPHPGVELGLDLVQDRPGVLLAHLVDCLGREILLPGLLLEVIQPGDQVQHGLGRAGFLAPAGLDHIVKLAPHVGQTTDMADSRALAQGVVAGVAVCLKKAPEISDDCLGHLATAAGIVVEKHHGAVRGAPSRHPHVPRRAKPFFRNTWIENSSPETSIRPIYSSLKQPWEDGVVLALTLLVHIEHLVDVTGHHYRAKPWAP